MQDNDQVRPPTPSQTGTVESTSSAEGQDDAGWREIARLVEQQVRRDVARLVGAGGDDWGAIRETVTGRVQSGAAGVDAAEVRRRVEEVGRQVEEQLRCNLATATGAGRDADWPTIGQTLRDRIQSRLDPAHQSALPGGSGTAASAEDQSVPPAADTPDRGPLPPAAGGDDTGLPTVTNQVGETPRGPATP